MESFDLASSIEAAIALIRRIDGYINATEPFKLANDSILYHRAEALRLASLLLWPVIPGKVQELWSALGLSIDPAKGELAKLSSWGGLKPGIAVQKVALFPRVEQAAEPVPA